MGLGRWLGQPGVEECFGAADQVLRNVDVMAETFPAQEHGVPGDGQIKPGFVEQLRGADVRWSGRLRLGVQVDLPVASGDALQAAADDDLKAAVPCVEAGTVTLSLSRAGMYSAIR